MVGGRPTGVYPAWSGPGRVLTSLFAMIVKHTLDNGLTLLTESMPHMRSVAIGVWVRRGSRHESLAECGLSHFIEHMVFKGTQSRTAEQIAAQVDSIGGNMDAFTAKEYAAFHLKVLDEHVPLAVEILSDIVRHPLFDPEEMTREKKVIFEEMNMVEDTPDDLVMELLSETFWPDHPLGRPILGTRDSLSSFSRDQLAAFFHAVYRPSNLVLAAAGNLEHDAIRALVEETFGDLAAGGTGEAEAAPPPADGMVLRSKKELEQVHLCLGRPAPAQAHDDRYAAHILNTVLGGSMSSRLFQNVREKRGLAYSISSGIATYTDTGSITVYAGTSLDSLDEVIRLTLEEMRRVRDEPLPDEELRRAKDHLKGSLLLSLESTGSRMSYLARQEMYFGRFFSTEELAQRIERVTAEEVRQIAQDFFDPKHIALTALGNLEDFRIDRADLVC